MNRVSNVFAVVLPAALAVCSYICHAQTIPPGVGSRHSGAKLAQRRGVLNNPHVNYAPKNGVQALAFDGGSPEGTDTNCSDLNSVLSLKKWGPAKVIAFRVVCNMDTQKYTAAQIADGIKFIDNNINDGAGYADAMNGTNGADPNQPAEVLVKAAMNAQPHINKVNCIAVYNSDTKQFDYQPGHFLPTILNPCGQAGVLA